MPDPSILSAVTVVLWRPKSPGNVGSVARAMKNMGFSSLRIADPIRYDDPRFFDEEASRMAWNAADRLAAREEHADLGAALADATLVAGTTSEPPGGHGVLPPRDLARVLLDAAERGRVALLFGQEDIGLTKETMARCQILGSIPSSGAYASLNLAQAALIFLYEIRLAALDRSTDRVAAAAAAAPTQAEMEGFYDRLVETLDAIGYFEGSGRGHMVRELRRIFNRALLTRREVMILEGILHRINWSRARPREGS